MRTIGSIIPLKSTVGEYLGAVGEGLASSLESRTGKFSRFGPGRYDHVPSSGMTVEPVSARKASFGPKTPAGMSSSGSPSRRIAMVLEPARTEDAGTR